MAQSIYRKTDSAPDWHFEIDPDKMDQIVDLVQAEQDIPERAIIDFVLADWSEGDEHQAWLNTASAEEIAGWAHEGLRNWDGDDDD